MDTSLQILNLYVLKLYNCYFYLQFFEVYSVSGIICHSWKDSYLVVVPVNRESKMSEYGSRVSATIRYM